MTNQKWPELYIYLDGIEDEASKVSCMWIVYPNGSIDVLNEYGECFGSNFDSKEDLLFNGDVELVGEIKPYPSEKKWKPQYNQVYFFISDRLSVDSEAWLNWSGDIMRYENGNCFRTKKEAKEKLEQIKAVLRSE